MSNGKEQAFVSAVQERSHQLYRIAMGYLHSAQDAEDKSMLPVFGFHNVQRN